MSRRREGVIRIRIQCPEDADHAKIIQLKATLGHPIAQMLAELLCGTSEYYIFKPGDGSPIGRCIVCGGGPLTYQIEEFEGKEESAELSISRV